jgi:hypothetical protein
MSPRSLLTPLRSSQMSNSYTNSSQLSTSTCTSVLGKHKRKALAIHPPAEDPSPTRSRVRSSTNNLTETAAEDLLKTPINKPEPTPVTHSTAHVVNALARAPSKRDNTYFTAREFQAMLFHKCKGSIVGFMNVRTFLDIFLPWRSEPVSTLDDSPRFPSYSMSLEKDIYGPFVRIFRLVL